MAETRQRAAAASKVHQAVHTHDEECGPACLSRRCAAKQLAEGNRPLAICKDLNEFAGAWRFSDEFHHQCLHWTQILEQPRTRIRRTPALCYGTVNVSAHEKSAAKEDEQSPAEIKGEKSECHRRSLRSDQS